MIHMDAKTHQQIQAMNPAERLAFINKLTKQRNLVLQQFNVKLTLNNSIKINTNNYYFIGSPTASCRCGWRYKCCQTNNNTQWSDHCHSYSQPSTDIVNWNDTSSTSTVESNTSTTSNTSIKLEYHKWLCSKPFW